MRQSLANLLEYLGIEVCKDSGNELLAICPKHYERMGYAQLRPHWSINAQTGMHQCFSCGYKGTLVSLVMDLQQCGYEAAKKRIRNIEINLPTILDEPIEEERDIPLEAIWRTFSLPPKRRLSDRRINVPSALEYGVKWCKEAASWVIPIRSPQDGSLWGWQYKNENGAVMNWPTGVRKSKTLFGYEFMPDHATNAWIVESPLDVLRVQSVLNQRAVVVATFGAYVSDYQVRLLDSVDNIILALDNDQAGVAATSQIASKWGRLRDLWLANYGSMKVKDPGDMTDNEVREFFVSYQCLELAS